jgi:signal transduction histidine kinase
MTQLAEGDPLESPPSALIESVVAAPPAALDALALLRALEAVSTEAGSTRHFLSRAAEVIAGALGAPRCVFWRLRGESLVAVDAEPFGFTVAERRALHSIFVPRSAHDSAARVLWRSQLVAGSTSDTVGDDRYLTVLRSIGIEHHVTVPWQWGGRYQGMIAVYDAPESLRSSLEIAQVLEAAGMAAALVTELQESEHAHSTLAVEEGSRTREAALLREVVGSLTAGEDVTAVFGEAARVAAEVVSPPGLEPRRAAFLQLVGDDTLVTMAEYDVTGERFLATYPLADFPSLERVVATGQVVVDDYADLAGHAPRVAELARRHRLQSRAMVPVRSGGRMVGVLTVGARDAVGFDEDQLQRVTAIANIVGLGLGNTALAQALSREAEHSQELERLKGEFLNVAAHELRSPLGIIKGYVSMLRDGTVPEARVAGVLGLVDLKADEMGRLITEMLETARLDAVGLELSLDDVNMIDVVQDAIHAAKHMIDSRHCLHTSGTQDPIIVRGDRARLTTALANLIDNAIKYSPDGGDVDVSWASGDGAARVEVRDQGIGISAEQLPVLFTRFGRVVTPETSHIRGTGLGLYLSRETVLRHGGEIELVSEPGSGSTFTITLPLKANGQAG